MDNFMHCDLHPGNIVAKKTKVVHNDNVNSNDTNSWWNNIVKTDERGNNTPATGEDKYIIVFLDAGKVTSLTHIYN